jgi:6-pyruvoyltetrahydropterin/6-carboxytetrahydropterin synthase
MNDHLATYSIRVAGDELRFSAAHFIAFADRGCESLHGHDYLVTAELRGPLNTAEYVIDFVRVQTILKAILQEWDHRTLLPDGSGAIGVEPAGEEYIVTHGGRRWILPRGDCVVLSVANTTGEMLARHLGERLIEALSTDGPLPVAEVILEVAESSGFAATCRLNFN